ncbi:antibiotic biosynthesis monooxygenase [Pseudochrobactrum algeriensis]|uniref:putative quinol monooxygenase n=1 Tax=Pseudochrobactrum algeriensis TaxID=2834768 RepID=UPI001BD13FFD|nr:putative quinol monooxygenase [Pseudochrobactrum algeriensis]MBX8811228.1 antibiotic biosynthesis monooxygenase [Ochrobactrum sp. MR34]QVQ38153.1 antibiotic biosynthesis monooxygenase [Pseudochrobactrum algeriensis]QVQ41379.1 antibiotic biosynthesis monooxygenase [Pseudochrobactrum algeriensis]QVQ45301.1 antibiotic biosynthesis monooxygenase [Pseudochrobactrum algeriensis]
MGDLFVVVSLRAKAGKEGTLRRDLKAIVDQSRKEEGNISYDLFIDRTDPSRFVFIEHWASQEHQYKHHNEGPHIQFFHENGAQNVENTEFAYFLDRLE